MSLVSRLQVCGLNSRKRLNEAALHCTVVLGCSAVPFIIELRFATRSRGRAVSRWFTRLFFRQMLSETVWHVVHAKYSRVVVRERQNGDDKRGSATWTREMQLRSCGAHALLGRQFGEDVAAARARCVLADWLKFDAETYASYVSGHPRGIPAFIQQVAAIARSLFGDRGSSGWLNERKERWTTLYKRECWSVVSKLLSVAFHYVSLSISLSLARSLVAAIKNVVDVRLYSILLERDLNIIAKSLYYLLRQFIFVFTFACFRCTSLIVSWYTRGDKRDKKHAYDLVVWYMTIIAITWHR